MNAPVEIRMPRYPECWESCGSCASGDVFVLEVFVQPGDRIEREDNIISIETGKVALDIPSPLGGRIVEVRVAEGDALAEGQVIATIDVAD